MDRAKYVAKYFTYVAINFQCTLEKTELKILEWQTRFAYAYEYPINYSLVSGKKALGFTVRWGDFKTMG